jgi:flagellar assembly factor FliW
VNSTIIKTGRFGEVSARTEDLVLIPQGLLGFPHLTQFCLVDSGDDTLILWLQSLQDPEIVFPVLEPRIFKSDYTVRLSASELRDLKLANVNQAAVFCVLTISENIAEMTANLKAPIVINLAERVARQVVLQENEYSIRHPMFKELRTHLVTMESQRLNSEEAKKSARGGGGVIAVSDLIPAKNVKSLQVI